jgi:hypothetical protein
MYVIKGTMINSVITYSWDIMIKILPKSLLNILKILYTIMLKFVLKIFPNFSFSNFFKSIYKSFYCF